MRFSHAVILASLAALALAGSAGAQTYSDQDVFVNAPAGPSTTLLYPGGQYSRTVGPLLQPGERPGDTGQIQLHMPVRKQTHVRTAKAPNPERSARLTPPRSKLVLAKPVRAKPVLAKPVPRKSAAPKPVAPTPPTPTAPTPTAPQGMGVNPFAFNSAAPQPVAPQPVKPKPEPIAPKAKPVPAQPKIARAEPPPRSVTAPPTDVTPGLTRRSSILFAADATDPAQSALGAIKFLASDLNKAMTGAGSRIELKAYGGARGDKSSDAHRLALKRALSIRQVLIDDGVPTDRIDVQAAGGVDDDGPTDRVDVYIKA